MPPRSRRMWRGSTRALWFDDVHGTPAWRRHMTGRLALEVRETLA